MKPYSEGDFVKKYLTDVAEEMCPKMVQEFEKISLLRWTIARRIDELAGDICDTLVSWSFAIDKSTDVKDAAQLTIFIKNGQGVERNRRTSVTIVYEGYYKVVQISFLKLLMLLISLVWTYRFYAESQLMVLEPCSELALD